MRRYETIFILDAGLTEADREPFMERLEGIIRQYQGVLVQTEHWGELKLAYDIRGKSRGYYIRLEYCGDGALVNELERYCRITDSFLKFLTVVLEKEVDLDALPQEAQTIFRAGDAVPADAEKAPEETASDATSDNDADSAQPEEEN